MTEVMAAAQKMIPNSRRPHWPAAAWNAWAAGFAVCEARSSVTPEAVTPRTARKSTKRMTPVTAMPVSAPRVMLGRLAGPASPLSSSRCAPA